MYSTNQIISLLTGSGVVLSDTSGSTNCSIGFVGNCISGGGGDPPPAGLDLHLGECDALRFLSRFAGDFRRGDGDLRRGDGDLVFRLDKRNAFKVL